MALDDEANGLESLDTARLGAAIVAAYVSRNPVATDGLPDLIRTVHEALVRLAQPEPPREERPRPAVPISRSVQDDHIVCLEDGKKLKMLRRHLMTHYGMTPDDYRAKWGLPADYPMVAPNYAEARRQLAKSIGLGTTKSRTRKK